MPWSRERSDWLWLVVWGVLSSAWCLTAAHELGATFDEPGDVAGALEFWHTGSHYRLLRLGAMPLPMDVCALPIYLYEKIQHTSIDLEHGDASVPLFLARTGTLVFWWLLLFYAWRAGRELGGTWGGRIAVAVIACEPVFLAHACLATKDIAISACLLAFVYHFRRGREGSGWQRIGMPGIWFGIALLAKASALAFGPLCMLAVEVERLVRSRTTSEGTAPARDTVTAAYHEWRELLKPWFRDSIRIGLIGLVVMLVYCGTDWQVERSWVAWAHSLPTENVARPSMVWLSEHIRIFNNGLAGLVRQIAHNMRGHDGSFLLGRIAPRSIWYYFPAALSMKLSLGFLGLLLALLSLRPRSLTNWAGIAAAVLLAYSLKCNVQIGVRLMLPLVALGAVGIAAAVPKAWQECAPGWRRRLLFAAPLLAIAWAGYSALAVWPNGLCYTNELWGGTERGYLCLSDSNYDWGQGLPQLEAWRRQHDPDTPLAVWYFGTDPLLETLPVEHIVLHKAAQSVEDVQRVLHGHYFAASTTLLYGSYLQTKSQPSIIEFIHRRQPIGRTQTFLIYDFRE